MFKKIDTALLLRFPMLWNTKFPYMIIIGLLFWLLAFFIGFWFNDFGENLYDQNTYFNRNRDIAAAGTGITGGVIALVWFFFYIRNNGFKSLYPKKKTDLFKEWLIVFTILSFLSMAFFFVMLGSKYAALTVFSQDELKRNAEIAYKGRLLLLNDDYNKERQQVLYFKDPVDSISYSADSDVFKYKGREYPWKSMIANQDRDVYYFNSDMDSLYTDQVRMLYYNNDSVRLEKTLKQFFELLKKHDLKTNVTPAIWFKYFYHKPDFVSNIHIYDGSEYTVSFPEESINTKQLYVESYLLKSYYEKIINSRETEIFNPEVFVALLYLALSLSTVVIAFRVSSIRQWFVSVVTVLVMVLINAALLGLTGDYFTDFKNFLIALLAELIIFVLLVLVSGYRKNLSAVALNVLILGFPFVVPFIAIVVYKVFGSLQDRRFEIPYIQGEYYSNDSFLRDVAAVNLIVVAMVLFFLLKTVRNRKALPGN